MSFAVRFRSVVCMRKFYTKNGKRCLVWLLQNCAQCQIIQKCQVTWRTQVSILVPRMLSERFTM